jgi:hypothetical protein
MTKLKRKDHVVDLGVLQYTTQTRNGMQINCSENVNWTELAHTICPATKLCKYGDVPSVSEIQGT